MCNIYTHTHTQTEEKTKTENNLIRFAGTAWFNNMSADMHKKNSQTAYWKEWERAKSPLARLKRLPNLPQKQEGGAAIGGPDLLSFINFGELYFQKLNFQITW